MHTTGGAEHKMNFLQTAIDPQVVPAKSAMVRLPNTPNNNKWLVNVSGAASVEYTSRHDYIGKDGGDPESPITSQLIRALHVGYDEHIGVALSPDVLWYAVVSEVAAYVKNNAATFAHLFTSTPETKQKIVVNNDGLVKGATTKAQWDFVMDSQFREALVARIPGREASLWLQKFSTSTVESDVATLVAFMDAASPFYSYELRTRCGFPTVSLLGTVEDWVQLEGAVYALSDRFSGADIAPFWVRLLESTGQLRRWANSGNTGGDWPLEINKSRSGSGGTSANGWILDFVMYWRREKEFGLLHSANPKYPASLNTGMFPSHVSCVDFVWQYLGEQYPMRFVGGVLGADIALPKIEPVYVPRLGYAIVGATA